MRQFERITLLLASWIIGVSAVVALASLHPVLATPEAEHSQRSVQVSWFSDPADNRPPTAQNDVAITAVNTPVQIEVLANDSTDPDVGETLHVSSVTQPGFGSTSIAPDGLSVVYSPSQDVPGRDGFMYTVDDGNGGTANAKVKVAVNPDNDPNKAAISGRITDSSGNPLFGVSVYAERSDYSDWRLAFADANGHYTVPSLGDGSYRVRFEPDHGDNYVAEWYDDTRDYTAAVLVPVAAGQTTRNIDASLSTGGTISGHVVDDAGNPINGITVAAQSESFWSWTTTDGAGNYQVVGLTTDQYRVEFSPYPLEEDEGTGAVGNYLTEWFDNSPTSGGAQAVSVTEGSGLNGIDAALEPGGIISGDVTDSSANPLGGIFVYAWSGGFAKTDASGHYEILGIATGSYTVQFSPPWGSDYVSEFYNDKQDFNAADPVSVTETQVTSDIDAELSLGGQISGHVTDEAGNPLAGVGVSASPNSGSGSWGWASTDSSGNYTIRALRTGSYNVHFAGPYDSNYIGEYYNDAQDYGSANMVGVAEGQSTTGIDAALAIGGSISGRVVDDAGQPIYGVSISASPTSGTSYGYSTTDSQGNFLVRQLRSGQYRVHFEPPYQSDFVSEFYNDKQDYSSADLVSVTKAEPTSGIDAALASGGSISGRVTNVEGQGVASLFVTASGPNFQFRYAYTDGSGNYSIKGMPSGNYTIHFERPYDSDYVSEYYDNKSEQSAADPVSVNAPQAISGIDAVLEVGGRITGKVTDDSGQPIPGARVVASTIDATYDFTSATTNASGEYTVKGLASGDYRVYFEGPYGSDYQPEYYNDKQDYALADHVNVTAGQPTGEIDASLARGGSISGRLTNTSGQPVGGVFVWVSSATSSSYGYATSDSNGSYAVRGLPTGDYRVNFSTYSGDYRSEYYSDKPDWTSANLVPVTIGQTTSGIDEILEIGAVITGRITNSDGEPIAGAYVSVSSETGSEYFGASTDSTGNYQVRKLFGGRYRLAFYASGYSSEYYNNKPDYFSADVITADQGQVITGIDASLDRSGGPQANSDSYNTDEDTILDVSAPGVLANDSDSDGMPLTAELGSSPIHGSITLQSDGSFEYIPESNFNGTDYFTYRANDGTRSSSSAVVYISVAAVNDSPVAEPDSVSTQEDTRLLINVLSNDYDADGDSLTLLVDSVPSHGSAIANIDGTVTYTPDKDFFGLDSFSYTVTDSYGATDGAEVFLEVTPVNDPPVAQDDSAQTSLGASVDIFVLGNDLDIEGDPLTASLISQPSHGSVSCTQDGRCTYTPALGFFGLDSFDYEARDPSGAIDVATVRITVGLLPLPLPIPPYF